MSSNLCKYVGSLDVMCSWCRVDACMVVVVYVASRASHVDTFTVNKIASVWAKNVVD